MHGKGQSAMEFIMTYGWAILIIAVILVTLYSIGSFSPATPSTCIAITGYLCASPVLNSAGMLSVNVGQLSSGSITVTGTSCTSNPNATSFTQTTPIVMQADQPQNLTFYCPLSGFSMGSSFSGYLWIEYDGTAGTGLVGEIGRVKASVIAPYSVASFDGQTSQVTIYNGPYFPVGNAPISVTGWVKLTDYSKTVSNGYMFWGYGIGSWSGPNECGGQHYFSVRLEESGSTGKYYAQTDSWCNQYWDMNTQLLPGNWYFIAETYGSGVYTLYVASAGSITSVSGSKTANILALPNFYISPYTDAGHVYGYISNIQLYSSQLAQDSVNTLYEEGIGGAPVDAANLIGWWPLNGNVNDYSGNGDNGVPYSVSYTSEWTSGYVAP